jgi:hypothetical protein
MTRIPQSGDVFVVQRPFSTLAGAAYEPGDKLMLVEPTGDAPFKFESRVTNWRVKCKHFEPPQPESVWSGIWNMIEEGTIAWEHTDEIAVGSKLPASEVLGTARHPGFEGIYRTGGVPRGRAIHEKANVFFTKPEWEAVVEAAGGPDEVGDWLHARAIEALNARKDK